MFSCALKWRDESGGVTQQLKPSRGGGHAPDASPQQVRGASDAELVAAAGGRGAGGRGVGALPRAARHGRRPRAGLLGADGAARGRRAGAAHHGEALPARGGDVARAGARRRARRHRGVPGDVAEPAGAARVAGRVDGLARRRAAPRRLQRALRALQGRPRVRGADAAVAQDHARAVPAGRRGGRVRAARRRRLPVGHGPVRAAGLPRPGAGAGAAARAPPALPRAAPARHRHHLHRRRRAEAGAARGLQHARLAALRAVRGRRRAALRLRQGRRRHAAAGDGRPRDRRRPLRLSRTADWELRPVHNANVNIRVAHRLKYSQCLT